MMYCGIDPGDAVAPPKTAIVDGRLDTKRRKAAVPVWVKLPAPVTEALAAAPRHDDRTIADMLGHETLDTARHYSRGANRTAKMESVVTSFEAELKRRKNDSRPKNVCLFFESV